jgi:chitosanase
VTRTGRGRTAIRREGMRLAVRGLSSSVTRTGAASLAVILLVLALASSASGAAHRGAGLASPREKEIAMELVSSAENSTLDWRREFGYIEDIGDGRGYTGGLIGFCSGTGDMLALVRSYVAAAARNPLAPFLPALRKVDGTASHRGLGAPFVAAWKRAAQDPVFRRMQMRELDRVYFDPAVRRAKADGLGTLGQFIYYDALVMHGPGQDASSFGGIRRRAIERAPTPAEGGSEVAFLEAFLAVRRAQMKTESKHGDTSRIDDQQLVFLREGNLALRPPLVWHTYGDRYEIASTDAAPAP